MEVTDGVLTGEIIRRGGMHEFEILMIGNDNGYYAIEFEERKEVSQTHLGVYLNESLEAWNDVLNKWFDKTERKVRCLS